MVLPNNKCLIILIIIGISVGIIGCTEKDMILEKEYIFNLKTEVVKEGSDNLLVVSGLCGHSAYGIKNIAYERDHNSIAILIQVSPGERGDFEIKLKLDNNIEKVLLGNNKSMLWERHIE